MKRIVEQRPLVDKTLPITISKLRSKPKKDQLLEDRNTEIERENRILLEKMSNIFSKKTTTAV